MNQQLLAGRYAMGRLLGKGDVGTVHAATDTRTGKPVVVKELTEATLSREPLLVERLRQENAEIQRMGNPVLTPVQDIVAESAQTVYLVMEYIEGATLQETLRGAPMGLERALLHAYELAGVLEVLHSHGITHRAFNSDNVLVDTAGKLHVTDTGVEQPAADLLERGEINALQSLSPEELDGAKPDTRSDAWAFGVILYELLTGKRPFTGATPQDVVNRILMRSMPDPMTLRSGIPPQIAALLARLLDKNPAGRPTVRQAGRELERALRERGLLAQTTQSAFRTQTAEVPAAAAPVAAPPPRRTRWALPGTLALLALIVLVTLLLVVNAPGAVSVPIQPVAPGEYMVLVATLATGSGQPRDVTGAVFTNLQLVFEQQLATSNVRVRRASDVISTPAAAFALAQAHSAAVIVWGSYDDGGVTLNVQVGSIAPFRYVQFDRAILERTANVQVRLTNEFDQSVAPQVLGVLGVLQAADGDFFQMVRVAAGFLQINVLGGALQGDGVAVQVHQYFASYLRDVTAAGIYLENALALDPENAILYALRAQMLERTSGDLTADSGAPDALRARQLGPASWALPIYHLAWARRDELMAHYEDLVTLRPEDWWAYFLRGAMYFGSFYDAPDFDEFTPARADMERAIALNPQINLPHAYAVMIALWQGRLDDARTLYADVQTRFPDAVFFNNVMRQAIGADVRGVYLDVGIAFSYMAAEQFARVIETGVGSTRGQARLPVDGNLTALYLMKGYAACRLSQLDDANQFYRIALSYDAGVPVLNLLRADVRLRSGRDSGAQRDLQDVRASALAALLAPSADAVQAGTLTCENFFDAP